MRGVSSQSWRTGPWLAAVLVLCAALGRPVPVAAEPAMVTRTMRLSQRDGTLLVDTSITELFDQSAYQNLSSGVPTTVVLRAYVYPAAGGQPVALQLLRLSAVYDIWDESYLVRIERRGVTRNLAFRRRADALKAITELRELPVVALAALQAGQRYVVALVAELNPVSAELLAEMRRWLSRPASQSGIDISSSFFGSFVSIFVNPRFPEAERVLRVRSQPFVRGRP